MNCELAKMLIDAYHDGELSPSEEAQIREHLQTCAGCAAELQYVSSISKRAAAVTTHMPPALAAKVQSRLGPARKRVSKPLLLLAAALLLIGVVAASMFIFRGRAGSPEVAAELLKVRRAFEGAESMHLVQTLDGKKQYDLWFGKRHLEGGKACWTVAIPSGTEPLTVDFIATMVDECDGTTLRLRLGLPEAPADTVQTGSDGTITIGSSPDQWQITVDGSTGLPIRRTRGGNEVLSFEFNKPLPKGLVYYDGARPHVQLD